MIPHIHVSYDVGRTSEDPNWFVIRTHWLEKLKAYRMTMVELYGMPSCAYEYTADAAHKTSVRGLNSHGEFVWVGVPGKSKMTENRYQELMETIKNNFIDLPSDETIPDIQLIQYQGCEHFTFSVIRPTGDSSMEIHHVYHFESDCDAVRFKLMVSV